MEIKIAADSLQADGWSGSANYQSQLPGINTGGHYNTFSLFSSRYELYYWLRFNEATSHMELTGGTEMENERLVYDGPILSMEQLRDLLR